MIDNVEDRAEAPLLPQLQKVQAPVGQIGLDGLPIAVDQLGEALYSPAVCSLTP